MKNKKESKGLTFEQLKKRNENAIVALAIIAGVSIAASYVVGILSANDLALVASVFGAVLGMGVLLNRFVNKSI